MKPIFTLFAALIATVATNAQNNDSDISNFTMGSKGGYGHSFIAPYDNSVFHPSWEIGVTMMLNTGNHLAFSIDGLYSTEGGKFSTLGDETKTNLSYFRIPIKVNYFFGNQSNDLRPKIGIGPNVGILLEEADYLGFEKMDLGAVGSLGLNYHLLRDLWISLDASYYHGLNDINKSNSQKDQNRNLRLELGLMVGF